MEQYYKTLGLSPGASQEEIKKQYRALAQKHHPDHGGDPEEFKKINEAYQVLSGKQQSRNQPFGLNVDEIFGSAFQDFIKNMHGGRTRKQYQNMPPEKDSDIPVQIELDIEQIKKGKTFNLKYNKSKRCENCNGVGGKQKEMCSKCRGTGALRSERRSGNSVFISETGCDQCQGLGEKIINKCFTCQGQGFVVYSELLNFEVKEKK